MPSICAIYTINLKPGCFALMRQKRSQSQPQSPVGRCKVNIILLSSTNDFKPKRICVLQLFRPSTAGATFGIQHYLGALSPKKTPPRNICIFGRPNRKLKQSICVFLNIELCAKCEVDQHWASLQVKRNSLSDNQKPASNQAWGDECVRFAQLSSKQFAVFILKHDLCINCRKRNTAGITSKSVYCI